IATEAGLEPTEQRLDSEVIEITREPGLDPFSSEATAAAQAKYQSWDVSEATSETTSEPAPAGASIETVSLHQYVAPELQTEVQPQEGVAETTLVSAETETDDFEKRVAEAMAAYQAADPGEHEVAPAITEREAEDAELAQSKYAVAHETEHTEAAH